jgi:hypothetical protein
MRWFRFHAESSVAATPSRGPGIQLKTLCSFVLGLYVSLFLCGIIASAQVETGQIAGTVLDQSGAVVPNAAVSVENLATNFTRSDSTSATGSYLITGLEPATYQVTVTSGSFKPFVAKVEVTVGSHVTLDAKLSVSSTVTEVQVVGEGGAQVNTQTQELSQVVDTKQMAQLPSLTRNPYDFIALSGNVSAADNTTNSGGTAVSSGSGQNVTNRGAGYAINGQRETGTEILLDGVENISVFSEGLGEDVPVDEVQEYSVITNNFTAEYGRASGGVVNVTTKAGSNGIHGTAWEFNRLSAYTANTYADDAANAAAKSIVSPKGKYTRNQFGYQAGGPILKNKLFMAESTEWTRVRSAASETAEIFDPAFIAMLPANAQAYFAKNGTGALKSSGIAATASQLKGAGVALGPINGTKSIPASTPVLDTVNFAAPFDAGGGIPQNTYDLMGRLDYNPTDKTQMFFRAGREASDDFVGSNSYSAYPQYDTGTNYLNQSYLYSVAHTFSPNLFLSAKVSFTRFNEANSFDSSLTYSPNLMFVTPVDGYTGGYINMPGLENSSEPGEGGLPYGGPQNTIQFEPDLSWTKGKHSLRFGFLVTYLQENQAYGAYAQAVEELGANTQDSWNDLLNTSGNPGGSQLVAFNARVNPQGKLPCPVDMYGNYTNVSASCEVQPPLTAATYARSYRYKDWAGYGQDSFKVSPKLTFNYGLRYEHYGVQHNNHQNLDSNFYFGSGNGLEDQVRSGNVLIADQSAAHGFWRPEWGTLAPRVGFAYDVRGNGLTSIRGGYGISYERNFGNVTYNASFNPPASAVLSAVCDASDPNCTALVTNNDLGPLGLAGPAAPLPPSELRHLDQNIRVAQTQFWSLSVQRQLVPGTIVELGYSGAKGVHLYDMANVNEMGAGQVYLNDAVVEGAACANSGFVDNNTGNAICLTRPNMQYSNINMRGSAAGSKYDGLNIGLQSQDLHRTGLTLAANYTVSHSLDDLSSTFSDSLQGGSGYIGSLGYTDLADPKLDWGSSDFDVRQRLSVSPIWATPWFDTQGAGLAREVLGGWTLSGIITARTGVPFSIFDYDNDENYYTVPRLTPATPITNYHVGSPKAVGANSFLAMTVPVPKSFAPLNSAIGMSDFGPFPPDMTGRNAFRGPGAWNADLALDKTFPVTERTQLEFRAEGFDILNHHNYYVNTTTLDYGGPTTTPMQVIEMKGGLGTLATAGNHDERRFGQFALKVNF